MNSDGERERRCQNEDRWGGVSILHVEFKKVINQGGSEGKKKKSWSDVQDEVWMTLE